MEAATFEASDRAALPSAAARLPDASDPLPTKKACSAVDFGVVVTHCGCDLELERGSTVGSVEHATKTEAGIMLTVMIQSSPVALTPRILMCPI